MPENDRDPEGNQETEVIHDISEVLGDDEGLWYKRRIKMPDLVGKTLVITSAEYRENNTGNYYILHIQNAEGDEATTTSASPGLKKQCSALLNRNAFPVRAKIVADGKGYVLAKGDG